MAPLLQLLARAALVCWLAVGGGRGGGGGVMADPNLRQASDKIDVCPRCDVLFTMLETEESGERVQHIDMVERGEPKSGTTFMYHWAHGALVHTCKYLNQWFGDGSCHVETGHFRGMFHTPEEISLIFDPRLGSGEAKCSCDGVDRVEISVTDFRKHNLPVPLTCKWQHPQGIARKAVDCDSPDGKPVDSFDDIALCMERAECEVSDRRHQFVVMRDPRAGAVSTFYHQKLHAKTYREGTVGSGIDTLDEYVLAMLPVICQWLALRYILFTEIMGTHSTLFWYDDGLHDAFGWHSKWVASAGVNLPDAVVEEMADAALREDFEFDTKGRNTHVGAVAIEEPEETHRPTWQEMLRPETLAALDVIARKWLPPAVLAKFNLLE